MTTTHPSANDSGLNLDHLEALARAASIAQHEEIERAVDVRYPLQNSPHASVNDKIGAARLAFRNGYRAALANQPAPTVPATREAIEEAAQVFEAAAAHNRSKGRMILAHSQQSRADRIRKELDGAPAHQPAQEQTEPLDMPLPCDITVGAGTIRKGVKLRALVARMESLHRMALNAMPEPTPEARAMIDSMIAGTWDGAAQQEPVAALQQAAALRTELSTRIRAAATADVTLAQAKLLIGAAEEIERAQQVAAPTWGPVHTVGDMVRNLLTLDQATPIFTAFHVTIDGERRCRTREVIISKERVVDGKWIDGARKDVPYTHIIWAKPDELAQLVAAPGAMDPDELTRMRRLMSTLGHTDAFELSDEYVRGVLCTVLGQAAGELERTRLSAALGNTPEFGGVKTSAPGTTKAPLNAAASDVLAERQRQVSIEDWTPEHDDAHPCGEIAAFAALYAMPSAARDWPATETGYGDTFGAALCPEDWQPKFGDRRRELVKAGALVLAEIERLDRAAAPKGGA